MFFSHTAFKGLTLNLVKRGVPQFFAMQIAGACYPSGARKEHQLSGFTFAKPLLTPTQVMLLTDEALRSPFPIPDEESIRWLHLIFGSECVRSWATALEEQQRQREEQLRASHELKNAFAVLGLTPAASRDEVTTRYRDLCRTHHPDLLQGQPESTRVDRENTLKRINEAYAVIIRHLDASAPSDPPQDAPVMGSGLTTTCGPVGPSEPSSSPPTTQRELWPQYAAALALGVVVVVLAAVVFARVEPSNRLSQQKLSQQKADIVTDGPLRSPEEVAVREAMGSADSYRDTHDLLSAAEALEKVYARKRTNSIPLLLWEEYLLMLQEIRSRNFEMLESTGEQQMRSHWEDMHELGLAWHEILKQAVSENDREQAQMAYSCADSIYRIVAVAATPRRNDEWATRWRVEFYGIAMENLAHIRMTLGRFSGDESLLAEGKARYEKCLSYWRKHMPDSPHFRRVVKDMRSFGIARKAP